MKVQDWSKYPNFTKEEFDCKETGENEMQEEFMYLIQQLRSNLNIPIIISSGFRSINHSIEKKKLKVGYHTKGIACDIKCWSDVAYDIVKEAYKLGFTGIGISQNNKYSSRFIHLDLREDVKPIIYSY